MMTLIREWKSTHHPVEGSRIAVFGVQLQHSLLFNVTIANEGQSVIDSHSLRTTASIMIGADPENLRRNSYGMPTEYIYIEGLKFAVASIHQKV